VKWICKVGKGKNLPGAARRSWRRWRTVLDDDTASSCFCFFSLAFFISRFASVHSRTVLRDVAEDDGALCWTNDAASSCSVFFFCSAPFFVCFQCSSSSSSHVCFCSFLCFLPPFVFRSCSLPLCYSFFTRSSPCFLLPAVFVLLVPLQFPSPFFCGLLWLL